jgi:hypothetical protein
MQTLKFAFISFLLASTLGYCKPKTEVKVKSTVSSPELTQADITVIKNKEAASWEFAKTKQLDKLKELLADDYQAFFGKIIMNKGEVLNSFQKTTIKAYRLSNIRVKKVDDNVAVVYYEALQDALDPYGDRWVPQVAASNIYVKRANSWYAIFYHETPIIGQ